MIGQPAPIGKITRVPLRDVWKHEAIDFTRWLEENLDVVSDHLDVPLVSAEREQSTGSFSVDLLAEDEAGRTVVIENQLERTDHDHLGKLITYLAASGSHRTRGPNTSRLCHGSTTQLRHPSTSSGSRPFRSATPRPLRC
jgi:hypothetical protein